MLKSILVCTTGVCLRCLIGALSGVCGHKAGVIGDGNTVTRGAINID